MKYKNQVLLVYFLNNVSIHEDVILSWDRSPYRMNFKTEELNLSDKFRVKNEHIEN